MSRFLARLVSSKKKDEKDDTKSPSFNFSGTKEEKTEDENPLIDLGKEVSFKTLLPIVEQQIEAATKSSNLSSAQTATPTAVAIANHPMVQKKKSSLGISKDRSGTVTEAPKKLRINLKQQSAENLMRACEDPKNPIYLRQMALLLLNASLANTKIQNLKEFLRLNVIQGDNTTSLLALEILDRVLEEMENSEEFKAQLYQICSELLPVCIETCKTSASLEQLLNLIQLCHPGDSSRDYKTLLVDILHSIGKSLYKNRSPSYAILRTHYGLDGVPLELQLFEPPIKTNDPKKPGTTTAPTPATAIASTAMLPALFKKVGTVEPTVPFLALTCIKTSRVTSNYANSGTGMMTVRVGTVNAEDNSVLLDIGSLSFVSNFDVRVSLPFQIGFTVYVETLIDPYLPIKVFSQKYEKQTVANIAVFLPYPQLCRFLRINVIPTIENPSHAPGFIETQTTAYGLKNVRDPKTLEKTVAAFQSKLSGLSTTFSDKRTELSNEIEAAKLDSDANSYANHAREVQRLYKECGEAQLSYHFCSIMYNALQTFSDSNNNVVSTGTSESSSESMIDRWTCLARVITNILTDESRHPKKEEPKIETPKVEVKKEEKKDDKKKEDDIPPPPPPPPGGDIVSATQANNANLKSSAPGAQPKAPVEVLLRWSRAKKVFRNYCVFGPADLRSRIGNWLCPQLELIPSADEWVPEFLNTYFSSKSSQYGMFPRKEVFELIHSMIKEEHYISVSTQLFSLLEQSTNPQNTSTYDVALTSWALLLLSKIVTLSSKPKVLHPDSKCINCGMSPIAGTRYRCGNCFNFDLCERCERKSDEIHEPSHVFLKIAKPLPLPPVSSKVDTEEMFQPLLPVLYPDGVKKKKKSRKSRKNQEKIHVHEVSCAGCGKNPIQGLRYKCVNCQDYDLCENCEGKVEHFPLHVFLKIWHPLPKQSAEQEGSLPKALVPNQALVPMQLHRALYPTRALQKENVNASPSKASKQEEISDGKQEIPAEPKAQGQPTFVDVLSKRNKDQALGKSLGTVLTMDVDMDSDEETEQKYQSSSGALPVMFTLLCNAANPITSNQESLLLVSNILRKIAKQFTLNDIKEDIIVHPKFGEFLKNIVASPSPFVHAAIVEMIETLCDPATYEGSAKYVRAGLATELTLVRHSLMQQITSSISQQNNPTAIEFLLELLDVLTSTKAKTASATATPVVKVEKEASELGQSTSAKPKVDLSWRTKSAPLPITPKEDKVKELHSLDDETTGFLMKFLLNRGLTEMSSGFWCSTLQLFKHADPAYLVKSPSLLKLFEIAMTSSYEVQSIVHDAFNEFVAFLVAPANPQSNLIRTTLLARVITNLPKIMSDANSNTGILLVSGIMSALAKPEVIAQAPLNVDQMFKILDALGQACKNREFAAADPSDAKNKILENLFKLASAVLATPAATFQMADFLKTLCSGASPAPALFLEFLHNQKPIAKGAKLSPAKKSEQLFGLEVSKLVASLSGASVDTTKYFLSLAVPLLKDGVKPQMAQLVISMTYNEELAKFFAVDLKGCDLLIQILLAQCGTVSTGSGLVLPELSAAILQQLYSQTSPNNAANANLNKKPVKPGTLEDLGYTSELQGADSLLQSIFKETASSNATVWTHKPPANNKDYEFSVTAKLPYNAVLKEVGFNAYRQWYVGSEMSELPSFMTVYVGRSMNKMKIAGRFTCEEQETLNGSTLKGFKYTLNQKTVARFVTLKFKPYNSQCLALTRIQLKGVSMQSYITNNNSDNPELLNLTTKVLAHVFSYAAIQSHLAKTFTEESALKLLGLLRGSAHAFIEDILYFVAKSNANISSALLKNLMAETNMTTQHAQLAGRLCAFKDEHAAQKLAKLKEFVFTQLSNKTDTSVSPALIPLMSSLCQAVRKVASPTSDEAKVLALSENELEIIHKCASDSLEGTHMEDAAMKLLSSFVQLNSKYLDTIIATSKGAKASGRALRVLAVLASSGPACGKALSNSGILDVILQSLTSQVQSNQPLNVVQESFKFFSDVAFAQNIRDWEIKNLLPKLMDLWPSITLPLVPLYVKVLSVCANMHKSTQETVGSFLVNLIKTNGTDPKKQQAVFELMEGLLSTQDLLYVALSHADDRTEEVQGLGTGPISAKSVPLEWDTTNIGPAIVDGANVKKTTADYCYTTVKSAEAFNSGVYYFEVEIVNSTGNIFVGICEFTHQQNCYLGQYNSMNVSSYGLMGTASPYFYCAISTEGTTKSFGKAFTKGDIIGCEVDFDAGTLTYFKNGETIGTPHDKGFKDKEYHAAVTIYAPNDEVNLVSASRTGVAKTSSKATTTPAKKPTPSNKEPLPFTLALDCPLRFHRSTQVYSVPTNTPFVDFFNEIQSRERLKAADGAQIQISLSANGKALTSSPVAVHELLTTAFSRTDVGDCEIVDLQFNTQVVPINQQDVQVQIPKDVGGNSKIADIVVKSKGLTLLVDNVLSFIKEQNKKKPEDHLTTWMKWLDVLKSQTQIEGYSAKFLQHKGCRALLFKAMKGELNLTPSKELIGTVTGTVPPIQAKERDALAVELDMFEPLLKSFGQLFAHTAVVSSEDKLSKAVRQAALEHGLIDRLIINLSDLTGSDMRNPNRFTKNSLFVELRDKAKREKDKREKERAANKANKTYWAKGTGYGTSSDAQNTWDQTTFAKIIELKSKQQAMMLNAIASFLDVPASEGESHLPNVSDVYDLLESSCIIPVLLSYLRNDSLLDIAKQMDLYNSLFNLVQVIARQNEFAALLDVLPNESGSVMQLMNQLNNMATMMLRNAEKAKKLVDANPKSKEEAKKELEEANMAKLIISVASDVKKALEASKQAKVKKDKEEKDKKDKTEHKKESKEEAKDEDLDVDAMEEITGDTEEDKKKMERNKQKKEKLDKVLAVRNSTLGSKYKAALVELQFGERDMTKSGGTYVHHYATRISQESSAMPNKLKRLVQEISSLSTGLPLVPESSVFMRVDEQRPDVMTAMITGPPGTPYSNGCFEFHIYCPSDYPKVAPVVNLETTGHGSVRFNPNLYNCGKVCLSLLGTWSGQQNEQWNEKTSTILQVLVSIQSLIMVERPYYNEPGYESQMGTYNGEKQSKAYIDNIRVQTMRWAMVDQLKNPSPGYEDVIKAHFKIKKQVIYREVQQWIKDSSSAQAKLLNEQFDQLKKLVDALGD